MAGREIVVNDDKLAYEEKMNSLFENNGKIIFVDVDNVRSQQIHHVRRDLRGFATMIMGKKTLQRKIVENRANRSEASEHDKLFHEATVDQALLRQNTGLIFTDADPTKVLDILEKHRVQAPARVNAIAPSEVVIPAGNTGMEPTQTSFFQALSIATKITKGTVEIISEKKVLNPGDKVDSSTAALLQKLKISPFYYKMEVKAMWDRGTIFSAEDLAITDEDIESMLVSGVQNLSALSLGAGIPTSASLPIVAVDAFKKLLAASVATNYSFDEHNAAKTIQDARDGKLAAAAPAAAAGAAPAAAKKAVVAESSSEDDDMGGLF